MKKIPKTFYIKGHKFKVKFITNLTHEDGSKCYGIMEFETKTIYIDKDLSPDEQTKTFLHEYAHALLAELHLVAPADGGINITQEGVFCEGFADIMFNEWNIEPKRQRRKSK